jgi:type IV secretory pathway component VirB8
MAANKKRKKKNNNSRNNYNHSAVKKAEIQEVPEDKRKIFLRIIVLIVATAMIIGIIVMPFMKLYR